MPDVIDSLRLAINSNLHETTSIVLIIYSSAAPASLASTLRHAALDVGPVRREQMLHLLGMIIMYSAESTQKL